MDIKLFDAELKVMGVLWREGDCTAKYIAINKIYDGCADKLFAALLGRKKLSAQQIDELKQIVGELE